MVATQDRPNTSGAKYCDASGNSGIEKRMKPYPPIFKSTPARITEPAVGASTCASGNHVWTGHIGTLTANDAKKASHNQNCHWNGRLSFSIAVGRSVVPICQ